MKIGAMLAYDRISDPDFLAGLVLGCEQIGFESVWATEHVVYPAARPGRPSPYVSDEKNPRGGLTPRLDPLETLAYLAGKASRIHLGTSVVVLPLRNPVHLSKQTATLDRLSGGRFILGIGVGWLEEEFEAVGVRFTHRGRIADEYIDVLRTMWREDVISFDGSYVKLDNLNQYPKPLTGQVPIVVCGMSLAAARRAGARGDGFFPLFKDAEGLPALVAEARSVAERSGRDAAALSITTGQPKDLSTLDVFASLNIDRVVVPSVGMVLQLDAALDGLKKSFDDLTARLGPFEQPSRQ